MRIKPPVFYIVYFTLAVLFFAVVLFPGPQAAALISKTFNHTFKTVRLAAGDAKATLPARIVVESGTVEWPGVVEIPFSQVTITPSLASLVKKKKDIAFRGQLGTGNVKGEVKSFSPGNYQFEQFDLAVFNTGIKDLPYNTQQHKMTVSFDVSGKWSYLPGAGKTGGNIVLSGFSLQMPVQSTLAKIGLPVISFDRVEIEFSIKDEQLSLARCSARGPLLNLDLTGDIAMLKESALNLNGRLHPTATFVSKLSKAVSVRKMFRDAKKKGIPIRITGSMGNPGIGFD